MNLYMFHGGTNFGFMAGVTPNWDLPYDSKVVTTSYGIVDCLNHQKQEVRANFQ